MTADDHRPAPYTSRDASAAFERLRIETLEARHDQSNLLQRAITDQAKVTQGEIGSLRTELDIRLRSVETSLAIATPVSLGARINDIEMWRAKADGETTLAVRVNSLEDWRNEMRGSLTFLKVAATIVGMLSGAAAILSWVAVTAKP